VGLCIAVDLGLRAPVSQRRLLGRRLGLGFPMLILGNGGGGRLGAFSADEHLGAGRFGCAGPSAMPLAWLFLTPAVFFVRGVVSGRDFVARCVLVLATLVGWKPLLLSPSCERFGLGRRDSCWASSRFTQISVPGCRFFRRLRSSACLRS